MDGSNQVQFRADSWCTFFLSACARGNERTNTLWHLLFCLYNEQNRSVSTQPVFWHALIYAGHWSPQTSSIKGWVVLDISVSDVIACKSPAHFGHTYFSLRTFKVIDTSLVQPLDGFSVNEWVIRSFPFFNLLTATISTFAKAANIGPCGLQHPCGSINFKWCQLKSRLFISEAVVCFEL